MKKTEVCIKARSPSASLLLTGQVTEHTTIKFAMVYLTMMFIPVKLQDYQHIPDISESSQIVGVVNGKSKA